MKMPSPDTSSTVSNAPSSSHLVEAEPHFLHGAGLAQVNNLSILGLLYPLVLVLRQVDRCCGSH